MIILGQQFTDQSDTSTRLKLINALDLDVNTRLSVIGVMTAQPKYLVFTNQDFPKFVVQFGDHDLLNVLFKQTEELSRLLPGRVPHPITLIEYSPGIAMLVQTGLEGRPWFTLRSRIKTENEWIELTDRIISSLTDFQQSVRSNSEWKNQLTPGDLLMEISQRYKSNPSNPLPVGFDELIEKHCAILEDVSQLECVYQHGDFCINNLLVTDEKISIMDFEHFGEIHMPLHDEFILLRSMMHFYKGSSESNWLQVWSKIMSRVHFSHEIQSQHIPGFFLHFLLWWILETSTNSRRVDMAKYYHLMLEAFCANEQEGLDWNPCTYFNYR